MASPLDPLIAQLKQLPGIGPKSAERLSFFLLKWSKSDIQKLTQTIMDTHTRIIYCETCFNICLESPCELCSSESRHHDTLCVVAYPQDVWAFLNTNAYNGLFHVLGGLISPLDGIHPDMLRIQALLNRIKTASFSEILIALSPTLEGEATLHYLLESLKEKTAIITTLAFGLPVGAHVDYADPLTLQKAIECRQRVSRNFQYTNS